MFWGTIHRMILIDLIKIFLLALVALTGLILFASVINEAMRNGLGPAQIAACIPLIIPSLLPYTVPTTTLFATCIVYGRLSADNEITALKAAGVHIIHVVWPALFLGLTTSAVTLFCYLDVIPQTGYLLRHQIVVGDAEDLLYTMLRKDRCIKHPKISFEIHVKNMQGRKLQDVIFKPKTRDGRGSETIAWAKEAELRVDMAHKQILVDMRQCLITGKDGASGYVESRIWPVDFVGDWGGDGAKERAMDMTWLELIENEAKAQKEKLKQSADIDRLENEISKGNSPPNGIEILRSLKEGRQFHERTIHSIRAEWNMRPALALGCLGFALLGCPIGIWFSKSDYLSAFITCFLPIVVVYYPLMFCMFDLGRAGKIPAWMGVYNADAILLIAGVFLFRRLARN